MESTYYPYFAHCTRIYWVDFARYFGLLNIMCESENCAIISEQCQTVWFSVLNLSTKDCYVWCERRRRVLMTMKTKKSLYLFWWLVELHYCWRKKERSSTYLNCFIFFLRVQNSERKSENSGLWWDKWNIWSQEILMEWMTQKMCAPLYLINYCYNNYQLLFQSTLPVLNTYTIRGNPRRKGTCSK